MKPNTTQRNGLEDTTQRTVWGECQSGTHQESTRSAAALTTLDGVMDDEAIEQRVDEAGLIAKTTALTISPKPGQQLSLGSWL